MSDHDDLMRALLYEQFGLPVKEWLPNAEHRAASAARIREIELADEERNDRKAAS